MAMQRQIKFKISKQPNKSNIVIVFDFDDTLFPCKKLCEILKRPKVNEPNFGKYKNKELSPEAKEFRSRVTIEEEQQFDDLSYETLDLLLCYVKQYTKQNVCIVTGSHQGWVKKALSYVSYMGGYRIISDLLFNGINGDISIYHPKCTQYYQNIETKECKDLKKLNICTRWKLLTFVQVINEKAKISDDKSINNTFVIIGDSPYEFEAAQKLRGCVEDIDNIFIHRIKLESKPTIVTLMREHNVLNLLGLDKYYQVYSLCKQEGFDLYYSKELEYESGGFCCKQ